jgi:hypothetical protein
MPTTGWSFLEWDEARALARARAREQAERDRAERHAEVLANARRSGRRRAARGTGKEVTQAALICGCRIVVYEDSVAALPYSKEEDLVRLQRRWVFCSPHRDRCASVLSRIILNFSIHRRDRSSPTRVCGSVPDGPMRVSGGFPKDVVTLLGLPAGYRLMRGYGLLHVEEIDVGEGWD